MSDCRISRKTLGDLQNLGQAGKIPKPVMTQLQREVISSQKTEKHLPYYSRVRLAAAYTAGPPVVLTFGPQRPIAFSYGRNADMASAGIPGVVATSCDTNIDRSGDTKAGERVRIYGISAMLSEDSDLFLAQMLWAQASVAIRLAGDKEDLLGRLGFIPCGGGLAGQGQSYVQQSNYFDRVAQWKIATNGLPARENYFPIPGPGVVWDPSGRADSKFEIVTELPRPYVYTCDLARVAAPGVLPWDPPASAGTPGTFVDIIYRLHCQQVTDRSVNT
jgi:hypothetical protein